MGRAQTFLQENSFCLSVPAASLADGLECDKETCLGEGYFELPQVMEPALKAGWEESRWEKELARYEGRELDQHGCKLHEGFRKTHQ